MRIFFNCLILFLLAMLTCSCSHSSNEYSLGDGFVTVNSDVVLVDTVTVQTSTVKYDSLYTNGKGVALVGRYSDGDFGKVTAKSFFILSRPSETVSSAREVTLDSVTLMMKGTGYFYGDTTKSRTINVYRVTEEIILNTKTGYLYNTSGFSYNKTSPLGSIKLNRRTYKNEIIQIHLDPAFGKVLLDTFRNAASDVLLSDAKFQAYLHGICIASNDDDDAMINGYSTQANDMKIRLYYHDSGITNTLSQLNFDITDTTYQFNQIKATDRKSAIDATIYANNQISSSLTDNLSYVQAGTGLTTRIEFPYLRQLSTLSGYGAVLRAVLVIKPLKGSYSRTDMLPTVLNLSKTDYSNATGSYVTSTSGTTLTGSLQIDVTNDNNTEYSYDITSYVQSLVISENGSKNALLLIPPTSAFYTTLERLTIGNTKLSKDQIKLYVYYMLAN
jgi:hypothetical protein